VNTLQSQVKLNLSTNLKQLLENKAGRFGMPVAAYVKHLILKDVEVEYPVFEMSEKAEQSLKQALKDEKAGKLVKVEDIDKFFDEL
jgi:predicted DNA-binding protein